MLNFDEINDNQLKSISVNGIVYEEFLIETKIDEHHVYTEKVLAQCTDAPKLVIDKSESISLNIITNMYDSYRTDFNPRFYRIDIDLSNPKIRIKGNGI